MRARALTVGVALCGAGLWAADVDRVLTLDQSIQTGLQNNPSLLSAQEDVRLAQQRTVEARALFFPNLALNMNTSRYRSSGIVALPPEFGSTVMTAASEPHAFYAGRLSLRQTIYNGGRNRANLQMAEAALAQAKIKEESIRGQVTVDAVKAFYDVLLAEKRLALAEEVQRDLVAWRSSDGEGGIEAILVRLRRERAEHRRDFDKARLGYLGALGLELYTQVRLEGELSSLAVRETLPKLLARAQESRLEIRGTEYQREIDRLAVNLSESERIPTVMFGAAYELNNAVFPLDRAFWNATLNVNLPIFDGFASRARIRQSKVLASQNRIARAEVQDRINREVREAYADAQFWETEMGHRHADVETLNGVHARQRGRSLVDRAVFRAERMHAEESYWEAVHGHRVARARLEKAVGLPLAP